MSSRQTPSPAAFLPITFLFLLLGWGGLMTLLNTTLPILGPRWLFFFLIVVAFTGTALPVISYLYFRFPTIPPVGANTIVRQSLWVGIYFASLAWLQYGRVFTSTLAVVLFLGFFAIEAFLRLRERSFWKP